MGVGYVVWEGRGWLFLNYYTSPCLSPQTLSAPFPKGHNFLQMRRWEVESWFDQVPALAHPHPGYFDTNLQNSGQLTPLASLASGIGHRAIEGSWYPDRNKEQTSRTSVHVDSRSCEMYVTSELRSLISTLTKSATQVSLLSVPPPCRSCQAFLFLSIPRGNFSIAFLWLLGGAASFSGATKLFYFFPEFSSCLLLLALRTPTAVAPPPASISSAFWSLVVAVVGVCRFGSGL